MRTLDSTIAYSQSQENSTQGAVNVANRAIPCCRMPHAMTVANRAIPCCRMPQKRGSLVTGVDGVRRRLSASAVEFVGRWRISCVGREMPHLHAALRLHQHV